MTDEPYDNAETEIAEENEEVEGDDATEDGTDVPSDVNESHPNEDDITETREIYEKSGD
jgi:hypothetical protein